MFKSFFANITPVVKNLLFINFILYLATNIIPDISLRMGKEIDLNDILGMHYWQSSHFNPAQLVTYAFMHGSLMHILFNMFALFMFGSILEQVWGARKFLFFYMVTAIGAAVIQQLVWTFEFQPLFKILNDAVTTGNVDALMSHQSLLQKVFTPEGINSINAANVREVRDMLLNSSAFITIGASGAVFGLLLAFGWMFPRQPMYIMFIPVPIQARFLVIGYGVIELFQGVANFTGDNVAHFAHLGGMLFGILLILYWKNKNTLYK